MGNLGTYQLLTTLAKKVGGPRNLVLIVMGTGYGVGKAAEHGVKKIKSAIGKKSNSKTETDEGIVYTVMQPSTSNEGIVFQVGEEFRILETDGDAILVDRLGDPDSPYYISKELFDQITNETKEDTK